MSSITRFALSPTNLTEDTCVLHSCWQSDVSLVPSAATIRGRHEPASGSCAECDTDCSESSLPGIATRGFNVVVANVTGDNVAEDSVAGDNVAGDSFTGGNDEVVDGASAVSGKSGSNHHGPCLAAFAWSESSSISSQSSGSIKKSSASGMHAKSDVCSMECSSSLGPSSSSSKPVGCASEQA
ncbi:hypothetical protein PF008_g16080 [Phytophthora fragariae]|uniref:Uncharacterized protein n=1 Tax=Phytophthora fragariae TaxID=53985 RepID=A0A6G0RC87_9STRA|nr:hypothetical protein PF008_g16080 [Phytophthora fragariae]